MKALRLAIAATVVGATLSLAAPANAVECAPDDSPGSCRPCDYDKLNSWSRRLTGQDLILCPM